MTNKLRRFGFLILATALLTPFQNCSSGFKGGDSTSQVQYDVGDSNAEVPTSTAGGAKLIWSDEFSKLDLASATNPNGMWRPNSRWQNISSGGFKDFAGTSWNINPNHPDFSAYTPFSVKNGILTIRTIRTPAALKPAIQIQMDQQGIGNAVPAWSGGYLVENPKVRTHKYGYFEYRVRWPNSGKGMFPALWLLGSEGGTDALNKGAAEIDIFEIFGKPGTVKTTLHLKDNQKVGPTVPVGSYDIDVSQWHTYGVDWQPDSLKFYVDRRLGFEVTGEDAKFFSTTMSVRLNYAMDANWFPASLKSDATTPDELLMNVDYVRVFDKFPY
jgi:beta-glucanase (GH16 family)